MWIPRLLAPFVVVGATLAATGAEATMLTQAQGDVRVDRGDGFKPVAGATTLAAGDRLQIGAGGSAQLVYPDGCIFPPAVGSAMTVAEQSPCAIRAAYPKPFFAGAGDQFTHTISGPAKKAEKPVATTRHAPPSRMAASISRAKAKPPAKNLFSEAHLVRTSPAPLHPTHLAVVQPVGHGPTPPLQSGHIVQQPLPPGQTHCIDLNSNGKIDAEHECPGSQAGLPQPAEGQLPPGAVEPAPPPVAPPPSPVLGGLGAGGLSTGAMIVGGVAVVGGIAVIASAAGKQDNKKPASP